MAQTWRCDQGDNNLSYVFETNVDTGEVSHPCIDHWLMRCVAVAESLGWTAPEPAPEPEPEPEPERVEPGPLAKVAANQYARQHGQPVPYPDVVQPVPEPDPPDPMVTKVVRRGQTRGRSKAERGAMHAHLREADAGTDTG